MAPRTGLRLSRLRLATPERGKRVAERHLWPCAEGRTLRPRPAYIRGLVRKDKPTQADSGQHLRPCAERQNPPSPKPAHIRGLVRKDTTTQAETGPTSAALCGKTQPL